MVHGLRRVRAQKAQRVPRAGGVRIDVHRARRDRAGGCRHLPQSEGHVHRPTCGGAARVGTDVERPVPAGMTVSFGVAVPSRSTIQPRPFGACERGGALCARVSSAVGTGGTRCPSPRRDRHGGRVHRAGTWSAARSRGPPSASSRHCCGGTGSPGSRRQGRSRRGGELRVVEVEREEPLAAGAVELPAHLGRRDVAAVAVEDCDRSNAKAGAVGAGLDEHASVNPQLRLELSGAEPPAPRALALTLANGQELLRARRGDDDRLGAERGGAHRTALEAVPLATRGVLAGERDACRSGSGRRSRSRRARP